MTNHNSKKYYELLPTPVLFNYLKHHLGYTAKLILSLKNEKELHYFIKDLKLLGNSQIDVYLGSLSPLEIAEKAVRVLKKRIHLTEKNYIAWLKKTNQRYRIIYFDDGTGWTLLPGNTDRRYLHIHPERNGKQSMRIKALTLKTAIAVCAQKHLQPEMKVNLENINFIRINLLDISPVKTISYRQGIGKMIKILSAKIATIP